MDVIQVVFDNGNYYDIELIDSPIKSKIVNSLKHLQHIKLPFETFDNPFSYNLDDAITQITTYSKILDIKLNVERLNSQSYLNYLHSIYENGYYKSPSPNWLQYHEAIHIIEKFLPGATPIDKFLYFDYREKAGKLGSKFLPAELTNFTTVISPGDCVVGFNELGKTPLQYWKDKEPDDFNRFCKLAKPMLKFNFAFRLYFEPVITNLDISNDFVLWYNNYKQAWCNHWGIDDWSVNNITGVIKIGQCNQWDKVMHEMQSGSIPEYLKLLAL